MKNRARFLSMPLALVMVLSIFASAAAEERPTLKVALTTSSMVTDYEDNYFTNYLEDKLGINIEFYMLPVDAADTRTKIALIGAICASGTARKNRLISSFGAWAMKWTAPGRCATKRPMSMDALPMKPPK